MKVNIDKTLEVSDEQRRAIALHIDGAGAKKRDATRDEMKDFIWTHGSGWAIALQAEPDDAPQEDETAVSEPEEDLVGVGEVEDPMDLI